MILSSVKVLRKDEGLQMQALWQVPPDFRKKIEGFQKIVTFDVSKRLISQCQVKARHHK